MSEKPDNRRRNYFIDKSFQGRFIIKFCLLSIGASLITAALIYYCNRQTTTLAFENLKVVTKSTSDFILPIILQILAGVAIVTAAATISVTLFASHRLAGPLYRLRMDLEKMKNGDLTKVVKFRTDDQLKNVAAEFDGLRVQLKESFGRLKKDWAPVKASLLKLRAISTDDAEKKRIDASIQAIDLELIKFKTE